GDLAQLRRLRARHARPARPAGEAPGTNRRARQPFLPDREPLPLQREVLPTLGASLPALRGNARAASRGARGHAGRGPAAEAAAARVGRGRELSSELAAERSLLRLRHWGFVIMGGVAIALLPWTVYLSITLPPRHESVHWDIVWPGLDVGIALAVAVTVVALVRLSVKLPIYASIAGTLLLCDAWFDTVTSQPGSELAWADARGHRQPHRQVEVHGAVRLRLHEPWRGAAPHLRGRGDDSHQGRGRHRRHRQRGHAHASRLRGHPAARLAARGRALLGGQEPAGPCRAGAMGRRARAPAGGHLHCGRDRDSGRRGFVHAARRRRRLRRLRDLQVGRSVDAREGDRRGDDALPGRRGARARLAGSRR